MRATRFRRCSSSSSRRSSSSTSRCPPGWGTRPRTACSGSRSCSRPARPRASLDPEREAGALDGLVLAPCDRSAIWLGKTLATLAFLIAAEVVALPAFALFFAPLDVAALAGVALANLGICAVGSLLAAMATASRTRELVLPLLFLPLSIPLVVGGVGAAISPEPGTYLLFLGLYDAVFAILSWASFEYVVTE